MAWTDVGPLFQGRDPSAPGNGRRLSACFRSRIRSESQARGGKDFEPADLLCRGPSKARVIAARVGAPGQSRSSPAECL